MLVSLSGHFILVRSRDFQHSFRCFFFFFWFCLFLSPPTREPFPPLSVPHDSTPRSPRPSPLILLSLPTIHPSPFTSPPPFFPAPPMCFYPTSHGKKGTPQAPPQNTVISLNFLPPPCRRRSERPPQLREITRRTKKHIHNTQTNKQNTHTHTHTHTQLDIRPRFKKKSTVL